MASIVVVHLGYLAYILPQAQMVLAAAQQAGQSTPRSMFIILKDAEQEICLMLLLFGGYLIVSKCVEILKDRYLFHVDLLEEAAKQAQNTPDVPGQADDRPRDLRSVLSILDGLPQAVKETPLLSVLMAALRRYLITGSVQNTSDAIESGVESMAARQDTENSMIRYLIWAIPSIGFIGTVRGIGEALSQANEALAGNIGGMTNSLGVAFNSTFVALLISMVLMFMLHQLQRLQDGLAVDTQRYCESFLLNRISMPDGSKAD